MLRQSFADAALSPSGQVHVLCYRSETMRVDSRQKTWVSTIHRAFLLVVTCTFVGCSGGSEEVGRIRVAPAQIVGVYELRLDGASERLELKVDETYIQDTVWQSHPVHRTGRWHIQNHLFDGSEVILADCAIVPIPLSVNSTKETRMGFGELPMYAHQRSGKVALARNEVADWYYERTSK